MLFISPLCSHWKCPHLFQSGPGRADFLLRFTANTHLTWPLSSHLYYTSFTTVISQLHWAWLILSRVGAGRETQGLSKHWCSAMFWLWHWLISFRLVYSNHLGSLWVLWEWNKKLVCHFPGSPSAHPSDINTFSLVCIFRDFDAGRMGSSVELV